MSEAATSADIDRLIQEIRELRHDIKPSVLLEERQAEQGKRLGSLENRMAVDETSTIKLDKKVDQWINRGIGIWLAALGIFTLANAPALLKLVAR
jgi:hypothetical protein